MADADVEENQQTDRHLVDTLLDMSEEYLANDQDTDEFRNHTGWEEAVQGWGRGPPLLCLSQIQRRGKRPKTWDADTHCLLCVDTKVVETHVSETTRDSPEVCSGPLEKPLKKTVAKNRPDSTCSSTSHSKNTVERLPKKIVLAKRFTGVGGLLINSSASTCVGLSYHQENKCRMLKDHYVGNVSLINCFAILPPLKTSLDARQHHLECDEVSLGEDAEDMVDILQRGASTSVNPVGNTDNGSGEMRTDAHLDSNASEHKNWTRQKSRHLLAAFSIPISKPCDQPFPTMDNTVPHITYRLGRYPKQEDLARLPGRNNGGKLHSGYKTKNIRRAEPKLPLLLGTRVAIPASAQRL